MERDNLGMIYYFITEDLPNQIFRSYRIDFFPNDVLLLYRLIQVGTTPSVLRVFHVLSKDQSINEVAFNLVSTFLFVIIILQVQGASSPSFSVSFCQFEI